MMALKIPYMFSYFITDGPLNESISREKKVANVDAPVHVPSNFRTSSAFVRQTEAVVTLVLKGGARFVGEYTVHLL